MLLVSSVLAMSVAAAAGGAEGDAAEERIAAAGHVHGGAGGADARAHEGDIARLIGNEAVHPIGPV